MVAVPAKITDMLSELIDVCFWGKADMEFSTRRCLHMDPQRTSKSAMLRASLHAGLGDWLGTTCLSGPVIFFSGEEPEQEMRRRLSRVARQRGLDPSEIESLHFHFADPDRCLLGVSRPNGPIAPTPLFESLAAAVLEVRPALVVVDSIAAVFGGNQRQCRRSIERTCRCSHEARESVSLPFPAKVIDRVSEYKTPRMYSGRGFQLTRFQKTRALLRWWRQYCNDQQAGSPVFSQSIC